jgi:hypothetical protein
VFVSHIHELIFLGVHLQVYFLLPVLTSHLPKRLRV